MTVAIQTNTTGYNALLTEVFTLLQQEKRVSSRVLEATPYLMDRHS
jgi:hypothetical protein